MSIEVIATILPIHRQLAQTGVMYMFAAAVWGLIMTWRKHPMDSSYRGILAIGYVLGDVIGLLGLTMVLAGVSPRDPIHILYGLVTAVALPAAAIWQEQRKVGDEQKPRWYALASLFVFGVMLRGIITATR